MSGDTTDITYGEGDTFLVTNLLSGDVADRVFEDLKSEVHWQTMYHHGGEVPRLIAVQGHVNEDGSIPIYRHPSDESPPLLQFSPTVSMIREHVEKILQHPLNHVLIQFYRTGNDYISEHSDKTIDVVPNTKIVNVSLGAERLMILRTKKSVLQKTDTEGKPRPSERIPLPHNSMFVLGLDTNKKWLHGIRQDKRLIAEKTPLETAFDGGRISLTFRQIGTFIKTEKDNTYIFGQGATGKTEAERHPVVVGDEKETEKMIIAFGKENQSSDFNWEENYGSGFDVLHFTIRS
ncbi:hypothetical protein Clacol_008439 [Clathrus columnatus]|uniref:Fe2OG dioxygenase domain-containing protein n=1 Tax=Clathrus columnatus TaxID=1419009 RepID=A0AAV5AL08_9AGAM|nr:hypothetical protein Clacol_008439 [Clathrus columnatus]